jgi:hypothetical protein
MLHKGDDGFDTVDTSKRVAIVYVVVNRLLCDHQGFDSSRVCSTTRSFPDLDTAMKCVSVLNDGANKCGDDPCFESERARPKRKLLVLGSEFDDGSSIEEE